MSGPRWQVLLADAREQFQHSRTLRLAVFALVFIVWLYGILVLRDAAAARRDAWLAVESRIVRAKALAASGDWAARSLEAKSALADYETLLWKDGSIGLSQAAAQENASRSLAAAGLSVRQIRAASADSAVSADLPDILPIRVNVNFDFRQPAFQNWLAAMARERAEKRPAFVIDSLTVRGTPVPVVDAVLVAYAVKPGGAK